ncbi:MAG: CRISPR-associated protein [Bacteroidales bacterium]|nr:CRISPR-associated protein [Candidatus Equimonas faecalis]
MNIRYTIQIHSYWHCGSGLAAGADVDALVIRDHDNLPFIPGKTIKGLIREAVNEMLGFEGKEEADDAYLELFGWENQKGDDCGHTANAFFSNATLIEAEAIKANSLQDFLYESIAQTAINSTTGTAEEHSLRKTQVVVPCYLEGYIKNVPEEMGQTVLNALKYIKRLGVGRNRGLGRCTINGRKEENV